MIDFRPRRRRSSTGHWQDSKGWLASGKGASWFLGNWSISQIAAEGAELAGHQPITTPNNLGYFPLPYDESGGPYNVSSGPDWAMVINKNTANPNLAKAWLAFILTKTDISQKAGFIRATRGCRRPCRSSPSSLPTIPS